MGYISTQLSLHINSPIDRSSATKPRNMTKEPLDDFRYRIPNGNEFEVRVQVRKINIIKSEILYKQTERTTTHIEKESNWTDYSDDECDAFFLLFGSFAHWYYCCGCCWCCCCCCCWSTRDVRMPAKKKVQCDYKHVYTYI